MVIDVLQKICVASSQILPSAVNSQVSETETEVNISAEDSAKDQFSSQFSHLSPMQVLTNIQLDTSPSDMVDSVSVKLERNTAASVASDSINLAIGEQMTTSTQQNYNYTDDSDIQKYYL